MSEPTKCLITGCEREGSVEITLRLPPILHDGSVIAEEARTQTVLICDGHPDLLEPVTALYRLAAPSTPTEMEK